MNQKSMIPWWTVKHLFWRWRKLIFTKYWFVLKAFNTIVLKKITNYLISILNFNQHLINPCFALLLHGDVHYSSILVRYISWIFGIHLLEMNTFELLSEDDTKVDEYIHKVFKMAEVCLPCIIYLKNFLAISSNDQNLQQFMKGKVKCIQTMTSLLKEANPKELMLICSVDNMESMSVHYKNMFSEKIQIQNCNEEERELIFLDLLKSVIYSRDISPKYLSKQMAGASVHEMVNLIRDTSKYGSKNWNWFHVRFRLYAILSTPPFISRLWKGDS